MNQVPADRLYARTHEWVREVNDGLVELGISDHAQAALGDLVFVELPELGRVLAAGDACAVVESVKAASDVYSPIAGTVVAANNQLTASPEAVNQDPYGAGWIVRIKPAGKLANAGLLSPVDYAAVADAH
jgi:glycine cleavage system H protein